MRDIEADALRAEARQYVAAGMRDRVALINAALRADGRDEVDMPDTGVVRAKRTSTQAATRKKRVAS